MILSFHGILYLIVYFLRFTVVNRGNWKTRKTLMQDALLFISVLWWYLLKCIFQNACGLTHPFWWNILYIPPNSRYLVVPWKMQIWWNTFQWATGDNRIVSINSIVVLHMDVKGNCWYVFLIIVYLDMWKSYKKL